MLQVILIYLRRFAWVFLPTCFISLVFVPFVINLLDMVYWPSLFDHDYIYVFCAIIPCILALLYVFYCRHYVNHEDLGMFVKHRIKHNKTFLTHYFTLSGVLINLVFKRHIDPQLVDVYEIDLLKKFNNDASVNVTPVLQRISGSEKAAEGGKNFNEKAWADYAKLARYIGFIQTVEKEFGLSISLQDALRDSNHKELSYQTLARKSFLKALSLSPEDAETAFVQELEYFRRITRLYGHHLSEFLIVCLLRSMLYASHDPNQCQIEDLLGKLWVRKLGLAFTPDFEELGVHYQNEYFVTLYQERINIRQFYRDQDFWQDDDDDGEDSVFSEEEDGDDPDGTVFSSDGMTFFKHARHFGQKRHASQSPRADQDAEATSYSQQLIKEKRRKDREAKRKQQLESVLDTGVVDTRVLDTEAVDTEAVEPTVASGSAHKGSPVAPSSYHGYAFSFSAHLGLGEITGVVGSDTKASKSGQTAAEHQPKELGANFVQSNVDLSSGLAANTSAGNNVVQDETESVAVLDQTGIAAVSLPSLRAHLSMQVPATDKAQEKAQADASPADQKADGSVSADRADSANGANTADGVGSAYGADGADGAHSVDSRASAASPELSEMDGDDPTTEAQARAEGRARTKAAFHAAQKPQARAKFKVNQPLAAPTGPLSPADAAAVVAAASAAVSAAAKDDADSETEESNFNLIEEQDLASLDSNSAILTLDHHGNVTFISDEEQDNLDPELARKERYFQNIKRPPSVKVKTGAGDGTHYSYRDSYRQAYEEAFATYQKLNQLKNDKAGGKQPKAASPASKRTPASSVEHTKLRVEISRIEGADNSQGSESLQGSLQVNNYQDNLAYSQEQKAGGLAPDFAGYTLEVESALADLGQATPAPKATPAPSAATEQRSLLSAERPDVQTDSQPAMLESRDPIKNALREKTQSNFGSVAPSPDQNLAVHSVFMESELQHGEMGGVIGVTEDGYYVGSMAVKGHGYATGKVQCSAKERRQQAFSVLELDENATIEQIKAQYQGLAKCYNPEVIHDYEGMTEHQKYLLYNRLMSIRDAYEYLMEQSGELV